MPFKRLTIGQESAQAIQPAFSTEPGDKSGDCPD
jgi:hypothetical protein